MIDEAVAAGARQTKACKVVGITSRSIQRWRKDPDGDDRRRGPKEKPVHALSDSERKTVLATATCERFCELSPAQVVAQLADEGEYVASESTFYRILHEHQMANHREPSKAPTRRVRPEAKVTAPNQMWVWDITYLPTLIKGQYYYFYVVLDLFSRKIITWRVELVEDADFATEIMAGAIVEENAAGVGMGLHSDNGSVMRSSTLKTMLERLGVHRSFSRPRVSNDNAFAESSFRTLKYKPNYPKKALATIEAWRDWVSGFVQWYNNEHRHSGIGFVTPEQLHNGQDIEILNKHRALYQRQKQTNPRRWSTTTRAWARP